MKNTLFLWSSRDGKSAQRVGSLPVAKRHRFADATGMSKVYFTEQFLLSFLISVMIQVVKEGGVEQFEKAMPQHHWQRNKKQSVNYAHDSPFATERQLEDQRLLMQKNRNPQYLIPTKVDKVRSQVISSTSGTTRAVAVKANVLNKIVREASGVHNYTIVAPIRMNDEKQKQDILDPETNPRMRPYAQEAKFKPVLCSFGHRPKSASRTFHPATMKFRLKHGEIARGGDNVHKTGFGLPVSVLKQVLKAPKLHRPGDGDFLFGGQLDPEDSMLSENVADSSVLDEHPTEPVEGYENLFFSEEEHRKMFKPVNQPKGGRKPSNTSTATPANNPAWNTSSQPTNDPRAASYMPQQDDASLGQASWVSSIEREQAAKAAAHKPPHLVYPKLEPLEGTDGRPSWDQAHHRVQHSSNYLFQMRASKLTTGSKALSLGDRLKRFAALSVAETQPVLFCTEKQETDKKILAGLEHHVPKPTSHLGRPVYLDPNNNELKIIKHYRKKDLQKEHAKRQAREYQKLLKTIPQVEYFPTSRLAEMRSKASLQEGSSSISGNSDTLPKDSLDLENSSELRHHPTTANALYDASTSKAPSKLSASMSTWSKYDASVLEDTDWQHTETKMRAAMKAAKAGDTRALFELNLQQNALLSKTLPPLDTGGVE